MTVIVSAVLALAVIASSALISDRVRVASPLLLVLVGIGLSLLPSMPTVDLDPEWVLAGILPPLLYASSAAMPTMDFRREFGAIGGLSVVLVVVSSFVLGGFFAVVVPDLGLAQGVALGAIVSPTDAVATSIVKRLGVSSRITTMLEGESLLNDATALAVLRAAISASAAGVGFWPVLGRFVLSVAVACALGGIVGTLALRLRAHVTEAPVSTLISFIVPFAASIPAELLGASGLVAAVVAGLITSAGSARWLRAADRVSDTQTWRVVELVLEGAIFFTMGLQLPTVSEDVVDAHTGLTLAIGAALGALALTLAVRALYVTGLVYAAGLQARRGAALKPRLAAMQEELRDPDQAAAAVRELGRHGGPHPGRGGRPRPSESSRRTTWARESERARRLVEGAQRRVAMFAADIDYMLRRPLDHRHSTVLVWAGMRGAVTLAAAQTLPPDTAQRSVLVFIAFVVATASLLLQGGTLDTVIRWVRPPGDDPATERQDRAELDRILESAALAARAEAVSAEAVLAAQRKALLDARQDGRFSSAVLTHALTLLDADEIRLAMRTSPPTG